MNIIWLDAAPLEYIRWSFCLVFIVPGVFGAIAIWFYWPDTKGLPLEEVAAVVGDADEVGIRQRDIGLDFAHWIDTSAKDTKENEATHFEAAHHYLRTGRHRSPSLDPQVEQHALLIAV